MASSILLSDNGVSSGSAGIKTTGGNDGVLLLQTTTSGGSATTAVTVDNAQNVGVGVTPSAWGSTSKALQVRTYTSISDGETEGSAFSRNTYYSSGTPRYIQTASASSYQQAAGSHLWYTAASGTAGNAISFTQAMTLDASGNLGLGVTPSSTVRLDVAGPAGSWGMRVRGGGNSGVAIASFADVNGNGEVRIDNSGNLLVGTTTDSGVGVTIKNDSGILGRVLLKKSFSGNTDAVPCYYNSTYVGGIQYSNTATTFLTSSDARLKKDIVDAGSASERIDQIRIVSHGWKHDDATVEFGMIAQELFTVAPQAVTAGDAGEEVEKTWGIDYAKLVPMLIKAHQEQQAIITAQQTALTTLTARIEALEGAKA